MHAIWELRIKEQGCQDLVLANAKTEDLFKHLIASQSQS